MQKQQGTNFVKYAGWIIAGTITLLAIVAFPFWNLIPEYVTETVELVYIHEDGRCVILTSDNFMIPVNECEGEIGQEIMATYDVKTKERIAAFLP